MCGAGSRNLPAPTTHKSTVQQGKIRMVSTTHSRMRSNVSPVKHQYFTFGAGPLLAVHYQRFDGAVFAYYSLTGRGPIRRSAFGEMLTTGLRYPRVFKSDDNGILSTRMYENIVGANTGNRRSFSGKSLARHRHRPRETRGFKQ